MTIFVAALHDYRNGLEIISVHTTFEGAIAAYFARVPTVGDKAWARGVAAHLGAVGYWEYTRDDMDPTGMVIEYEVRP